MATAEVQRATAAAPAVHDNNRSKEQKNMDHQLEVVDDQHTPCSKVKKEHDPCADDIHGGGDDDSVFSKEEEERCKAIAAGADAVELGEGIAQELLGACKLAAGVQHRHQQGSAPTEDAPELVKERPTDSKEGRVRAAKKKEKAAAKGAVVPVDDDGETDNEVVAAPAAAGKAAAGGDNQLVLQDDKEEHVVCEIGKKAHEE